MAAQDRPRLDPATARAVIDPQSYAEWDGPVPYTHLTLPTISPV